METGTDHNINPLVFLAKDDLKEKLINGINLRVKLIETIKEETKKGCAEIIKYTITKCKETIKKLNDDKKYYRKLKKILIESNKIDLQEYENGSLLEEQFLDYDINLNRIKGEISEYFKDKRCASGIKNKNNCFWLSNDNLWKVNVRTLKKKSYTMEFTFKKKYNDSCKISNEKYFIHSCDSNKCYILDLNSNSCTQLSSFSGNATASAVGYIDDNVYIINGYSGYSGNERYNTITKQWSKITPAPSSSAIQQTGGVIKNKICITSMADALTYIYDPKTDKYSAQMKLPAGLKSVGHNYIITNQCMYQAEYGNNDKWKKIKLNNSKNLNFGSLHGNSYVFKKGRYLYFLNDEFQLFQIDTMLYEINMLDMIE